MFVLHRAAETIAFRKIINTTSCDWHFVFVDDWGLSLIGDVEEKRSRDIEFAPIARSLFSVGGSLFKEEARVVFKGRVLVSRMLFFFSMAQSIPADLTFCVLIKLCRC